MKEIKEYTANRKRKPCKQLTTRVSNLWTRLYYCESVGHISEETIRKYIEEQKNV
jgi:putative transposase